MTRERRWESLGRVGATVWFTGLPGAGKSTIATVVEERLIASARPAFLLDGVEVAVEQVVRLLTARLARPSQLDV